MACSSSLHHKATGQRKWRYSTIECPEGSLSQVSHLSLVQPPIVMKTRARFSMSHRIYSLLLALLLVVVSVQEASGQHTCVENDSVYGCIYPAIFDEFNRVVNGNLEGYSSTDVYRGNNNNTESIFGKTEWQTSINGGATVQLKMWREFNLAENGHNCSSPSKCGVSFDWFGPSLYLEQAASSLGIHSSFYTRDGTYATRVRFVRGNPVSGGDVRSINQAFWAQGARSYSFYNFSDNNPGANQGNHVYKRRFQYEVDVELFADSDQNNYRNSYLNFVNYRSIDYLSDGTQGDIKNVQRNSDVDCIKVQENINPSEMEVDCNSILTDENNWWVILFHIKGGEMTSYYMVSPQNGFIYKIGGNAVMSGGWPRVDSLRIHEDVTINKMRTVYTLRTFNLHNVLDKLRTDINWYYFTPEYIDYNKVLDQVDIMRDNEVMRYINLGGYSYELFETEGYNGDFNYNVYNHISENDDRAYFRVHSLEPGHFDVDTLEYKTRNCNLGGWSSWNRVLAPDTSIVLNGTDRIRIRAKVSRSDSYTGIGSPVDTTNSIVDKTYDDYSAPGCGLGAGSRALNDKLSVYPNPSGGRIAIAVDRLCSSEVHVEIFDLLGRSVGIYRYDDMDNEEIIDISSFSRGVYIVEAESSCFGEIRVDQRKIIKM